MNSVTEQFLCCTAITKLDLTDEFDNCSLTVDIQKQILDNTINSDLIKQYPLKVSYQRAFLKLLLKKIEESGNEIHDDLYIEYCRLVSVPDEESVHYRHFLIEKGTLNCVTLKESTNMISNGTTGLCSWQGALVLSKWCAENKDYFSGRTVLELGCGVGLTGISVISTCSPKQYVFSDGHSEVLRMLCENIRLNFLSHKQCQLLDACDMTSLLKLHLSYEHTDIRVVELKWEDIGEYVAKTSSRPDVIIGADILYESGLFDSLILGLKNLLTPNNCAVIAATVRNEDTVSHFLDQLGNYSLTFEECVPPKRIASIQLIDSPVRILKISRNT